MAYSLTSEPPSDPESFRLWVVEQLRRIEDAAIDPILLVTQTLDQAPVKLREGTIAIADGTNWDPGSGAGTYVYRGATWRKMD